MVLNKIEGKQSNTNIFEEMRHKTEDIRNTIISSMIANKIRNSKSSSEQDFNGRSEKMIQKWVATLVNGGIIKASQIGSFLYDDKNENYRYYTYATDPNGEDLLDLLTNIIQNDTTILKQEVLDGLENFILATSPYSQASGMAMVGEPAKAYNVTEMPREIVDKLVQTKIVTADFLNKNLDFLEKFVELVKDQELPIKVEFSGENNRYKTYKTNEYIESLITAVKAKNGDYNVLDIMKKID